jgi:ribosomal protein S18 acetylase RimI-like enzyme
MQGVRIRKMSVRDVGAVGRVAREAWADAYAGIIPEETQREFLRRAYSPASLVRRSEGGVFLVAEIDGEVVGFVDLSPVPGEADVMELAAIYVHPNVQGGGLGTRLLAAGLERLPSIRRVMAEVEQENLPARRFYEARGFVETARRTEVVFGHEFRTVEMTLVVDSGG